MTLVNAETGEKVAVTGTHPVADMFPMLDADGIADMAADIKANGQHNPVTVDPDGVLLDGRNRIAAAKKAKVPVTCRIYDGDPVPFIFGNNLNRRDLTKGQKAMIAASIIFATNTDQIEAANAAGVSQSRIAYASTVLSHAPELVAAVVDGKRTLDDAYKVAKANKAASEKEAEVLAQLEADAPDLAEKVGAGDLTLGEAKAAADQRAKEADQHAQARTRFFSDAVITLAALLDFDNPDELAFELVAEWRPNAVRKEDVKGSLTPDGLRRVAACLELVATHKEAHRG